MAADPITKNTVSDLLNYDISDDDDPFKDIDQTLQVRDDKSTLSPPAAKRKADNNKENDSLGLDEEVKIVKKRKPIAKLDETRLLSQPGIPKLRTLARSGQIAKKLHLKGKGHEFSDAAKLLNYHQLWLDNLYPRAKFVDALQLVEKAGHSKRMQTMRKEWIDEGKLGYARRERPAEPEIDRVENRETMDATKGTDIETAGGNGKAATRSVTNESMFDNGSEPDELFFPDTTRKAGDDGDDGAPEDDELDTLLAEQSTSYVSRPKLAEPEPGDDLDALLAEQEPRSNRPNTIVTHDAVSEEDEDDDLDALLAQRDAEGRGVKGVKAQEGVPQNEDEDISRVLDSIDAVVGSSSPFPTIDDDDENSSLTT